MDENQYQMLLKSVKEVEQVQTEFLEDRTFLSSHSDIELIEDLLEKANKTEDKLIQLMYIKKMRYYLGAVLSSYYDMYSKANSCYEALGEYIIDSTPSK